MKKILLAMLLMIPVCVFAGSATVSTTSLDIELKEKGTFNIVLKDAVGRYDVTSTDTSIATVSFTGEKDEDKITKGFKIWIDSKASGDTATTATSVVTVTGVKAGSTTIKVTPVDVATYDTEEELTKAYTINVKVSAIAQPVFKLPSMEMDSSKKIMKKISVKTKVNDFFTKTDNNKHVQIYSSDGTLLYSKDKVNKDIVLGTGQYVTYYGTNREVIKYKISVKGDTNGDGDVSSLDYIVVRKHIMKTKTITGDEFLDAADYDDSGEIKSLDYVKIKNYIMAKN